MPTHGWLGAWSARRRIANRTYPHFLQQILLLRWKSSFIVPQFDSINNIKTPHIYIQFVFYWAKLKQLHVWCVSITIANPASSWSWQDLLVMLTHHTIVVQTAENFCTVIQHETMVADDCQSLKFKLNWKKTIKSTRQLIDQCTIQRVDDHKAQAAGEHWPQGTAGSGHCS